jgi:tetratricopeptide (TPR) repeat protein
MVKIASALRRSSPQCAKIHSHPAQTIIIRREFLRPEAAQGGVVKNDNDLKEFLEQAQFHAMGGRYDQAIDYLSEALEIDARHPGALQLRGYCCSMSGRREDAIRDFSAAIELDPINAQSFILRGMAYQAQGHYDLALEDCCRAVELEPSNPKAYVARARVRQAKGLEKAAQLDFQRARELSV